MTPGTGTGIGPEPAVQQAPPPAAPLLATPPAPTPQPKAPEIQPEATTSMPGMADPTLQEPIPESLNTDDIVSLDQWAVERLQEMGTPITGSQGTTVPATRTTPGSVTRSQRRGTGSVQTNLFGKPRVGMAEAICRRIWAHRARQEEPAKEALSSSESEEDPVEELPSSSKLNPVTLNSSSEGEYKGTTTPSRLDDDLDLSPALARRPVTRSMPKRPTSRPKRKAYKSKATKPGSSSQKRFRGQG